MERREGKENPVERLSVGPRTRVRRQGITDGDDAKDGWETLLLMVEKDALSARQFENLTGMDVDRASREIRAAPRYADWFERERKGVDGKEFEDEFEKMLKGSGAQFENVANRQKSGIDFVVTTDDDPLFAKPRLRFELKRCLEMVKGGKGGPEKGRAQIIRDELKDDPPTVLVFKLSYLDGKIRLKYAEAPEIRRMLWGEKRVADSVGKFVGKLEWGQIEKLPDFDTGVLERLVR